MTPSPHSAPLNSLQIDEANVRRTGRGHEPQFVATIRAHGIIVPLVVRPNGQGYKVIDGGKRLASLQWMLEHEERALGVPVTPDYNVPITVRDDDDVEAKQTSIITAVARVPVHQVDQYEAFAELSVKAKIKPDDIAAYFGVTRRQVDQALALGALSPKIRDAWRAGALSAETAKAFTLAPDQKTQERLFKQLSGDGDNYIDEDNVKEHLRANENDAGRLVQFVGIDEYEKRGGKVTRDLFGADHVVSDTKLAKAMAEEKIEAECKRLVADGWEFAAPKDSIKKGWSYGRLKLTLNATEEEKAQLHRWEFIAEDWDRPHGERAEADRQALRLHNELTLRSATAAQKAKSGCFVSISDHGDLEIEYCRTKPQEQSSGVRVEQNKPAKKEALTPAEKKKVENAKQRAAESGQVSNSLSRDLYMLLLRATKRALKAEAERFPKAGLASILASIAADLVRPDEQWHRPLTDAMLASLRAAIAPEIMNEACRHEFDAKDYFSRVSRHIIIAAVKEAINADEARKLEGKKVAEAVKFAVANVPATGWLPVQLRTPHYDGAGAKAKAKPQAKAAKKKAARS